MHRLEHGWRVSIALGIVVGSALCVSRSARAEDGNEVFGRVRVTAVTDMRYAVVTSALEARYAAAAGKLPGVRIISVRRREDDPERYDATIYDYERERAFDLHLDAGGNELGRTAWKDQPPLTPGELEDAFAALAKQAPWSAGIADGTLQVYEAMPPVFTDKEGRRRVNLGLMARPEGSWSARENEIVSVHLPSGDLLHHERGAPQSALAPLLVCGPASKGCGASTGSCGTLFHFEWPAVNPVWKFDAMHPSCSNSVQPDGTGLELQNVKYRDKLVLKRAGVPVLNVKYENDACGPYRDWLDSESCFTAVGAPVGSTGFNVGSATPLPATFCEQGTDAGNFMGVAIHDRGDSLWLITETNAGWYRYVMQWRLNLDGSIEPIFGFGATSNGCTCNDHTHHAYWRFEWAIDGDPNDPATGINVLERRAAGSEAWVPVSSETAITRPAADFTEDLLRIKNPETGSFYTIHPGAEDGSAQGDAYAKADAWALAYNAGQINDPNSSTAIGIEPWVNGESLGASKRLVLWYRGGYHHDHHGGDIEPCELVGPKLVFRQPCEGRISLARPTASCSDALPVTLDDSDLMGAGTHVVSARSTVEPAGELMTLVETPAGSGHFTGAISTTAAAVSASDGLLSVANADAITIESNDSSACGAPNVSVTASAAVDCAAPVITGVAATNVTDTSATITWTTNEPATSSALHGASPPPTFPVEDLATYGVAHSLALTGLQACTTELFQVASGDAIGNTRVDTNGGTYHRFQVHGRGLVFGPDDVEAGSGVFTPSGSAGSRWHRDTCKAASPTYAWKTGSTTCPGTYGNLADTYLTSAPLAIPAAGSSYHLRFKERFETQAGADFCNVQISTTGGASWVTLDSYSGGSAGWRAKDYDLSAYSGSTVRVRFWFHSNGSTVAEGWYLDDLDLSRTAPCGASLTRTTHSYADACTATSGNGVLDPGEDVRLQLGAKNSGLTGATHVAATLSSATPGVVITNPTATYPDLAANGGSAVNDGLGFALTLLTGIPCGTLVDLAIHFTADQGAWDDTLELRVGSGDPFVCGSCAVTSPSEVPSLSWSSGKDALEWTAIAGASWYDLHRGTLPDLPALLGSALDSCIRATGSSPGSGAILTEMPPEGALYWYLVTAANAGGAGGAGSASAGVRIVNGTPVCP